MAGEASNAGARTRASATVAGPLRRHGFGPIVTGMRIDIWSDVVCPWCWIGKHRFQRGLDLLGPGAPAVEVHWHPFQLDPDAGTDPVPVPGYTTVFPLYQRVQYAMPGERLEDY